MDPDACRNCGNSGKHIEFIDHRCAIHERDDAERDKLQADAALARARDLCESSLGLMKRQMQELEDANAAIETLSRALAAAEDRRERVRRDLGTHGDVCLTARSNLEAAEEMAIAAAGRYFEAGRAVSALEEKERRSEPTAAGAEEDGGGGGGGDDEQEGGGERRWQRSNERFCKWLRQSEAQRQIMKSSWTKVRVAERLAGGEIDEETAARRNRVHEWAAARRRSDVPPEEEDTIHTEEVAAAVAAEEEGDDDDESEPAAAPAVVVPPTPAATRSGVARKGLVRGRTGKTVVTAPPSPAKTTAPTRPVRTVRRVESQTRSEPSRPTTAAGRGKKEPVTANQKAAALTEGRTTRAARTGKTPAAEAAVVAAVTAAAGRPQRVTRRRSRAQPYPPPTGSQGHGQPRWK